MKSSYTQCCAALYCTRSTEQLHVNVSTVHAQLDILGKTIIMSKCS